MLNHDDYSCFSMCENRGEQLEWRRETVGFIALLNISTKRKVKLDLLKRRNIRNWWVMGFVYNKKE